MCEPISITKNVLIPYVDHLKNDSAYFKREIISRVIKFSTPFFMMVDAFFNLGAAIARLGGRALLVIRIKIVSVETVSNEKILCNLKGIFKSFFIESEKSKSENKDEETPENWELNKYIGHVYVINLTDKPDSKDPNKFKNKLNGVKKNLDQIGVSEFERFPGIYGRDLPKEMWSRVDDNSFAYEGEQLEACRKGQAGCYMSHYKVIQDANKNYLQAQKDLTAAEEQLKGAIGEITIKAALQSIQEAKKRVKQYNTIMLLEDDNRFGFVKKTWLTRATATLKGTAEAFKKVMSELPADWGMLHLCAVECGKGGRRWQAKSTSHSANLFRLDYGLLANAVVIHSQAYGTILKALSKIDDPNAKFRPVDHEYGLLHSHLKAFSPKKPLAYQAPGDSAITSDVSNEPWDGTWNRRPFLWKFFPFLMRLIGG